MKLLKLLPWVMASVLVGCGFSSPDEKLNETLPRLNLDQILPKVEPNQYCTAQMGSDLLYGLGSTLNDEDEEQHIAGRFLGASEEVKMARNCLILAAPEYPRSLCLLAFVVGARPYTYDKHDAFNYLAYAAANNESCSEYVLYNVYTVGKLGQPRNQDLGMRWLERAARHGELEAREDMVRLSSEQGDLPKAFAWAMILGDAAIIDEQKRQMNAVQVAEGNLLYNQLLGQVTAEQTLKKSLRKQLIAENSGDVYRNHPEALEGLSTAQRLAFMANVVDTMMIYPDFSKRRQLYAYALIARRMQATGPVVDLWQNPKLQALLTNKELSVEDTVAKAMVILERERQ
ncbi:sel1 repeat family protein [Pseudomonas fluorescens]|uniref:sel1 repeat family protein n=1 Tax=Pseudomonas fluorescens TaxID=294 RepID=UPI00223AE900|nr:sel1 repeat family protein [Pseudomonas fluorescens]